MKTVSESSQANCARRTKGNYVNGYSLLWNPKEEYHGNRTLEKGGELNPTTP